MGIEPDLKWYVTPPPSTRRRIQHGAVVGYRTQYRSLPRTGLARLATTQNGQGGRIRTCVLPLPKRAGWAKLPYTKTLIQIVWRKVRDSNPCARYGLRCSKPARLASLPTFHVEGSAGFKPAYSGFAIHSIVSLARAQNVWSGEKDLNLDLRSHNPIF